MGGSDHNSIIFDIKLNFQLQSKSAPRYQYNKANYQCINSILAHIDWTLFFYRGGVAFIGGGVVPKIPNSDISCIDVFSPLNQQKIRLIVVYRPTTKETLEHLTSLIDCLVLLSSIDYPYYILGDFNFPNLNWASPNPFPNTLTPSESIFAEFFQSSNLEQIVQSPTRNQNYLDLVLTSNTSLTSFLSVEAPMGGSDHNSIIFDIKLNFQLQSKSAPRYQYNKANYQCINSILAHIDWTLFFYDCIDVESCYNKFITFLQSIIQSYVPISSGPHSIDHFPIHIQRLDQYRKNLWKRISKPCIREKYIETSNKLEYEISKFIRNRENKKLSNIKTKFDYISSFIKPKNLTMPSLIGQNNQHIFSNQIKSNILADQFSSVFSNQNLSSQTFSFSNHSPIQTIQTISIDPRIVFDIISRLDNSNNTSLDSVPNIFYKKCRIHSSSLLLIFSHCQFLAPKFHQFGKKLLLIQSQRKQIRNIQ
uniref:Endonuclease/exonuclease/phosphatase domain-containing protein n=2 Tax=Meloidogyne enterolobii TaxID=390850 RepID=A0A6V7X3P9_MELEN|nr:unnamed protein product [Meloidogyne enterolobii]